MRAGAAEALAEMGDTQAFVASIANLLDDKAPPVQAQLAFLIESVSCQGLMFSQSMLADEGTKEDDGEPMSFAKLFVQTILNFKLVGFEGVGSFDESQSLRLGLQVAALHALATCGEQGQLHAADVCRLAAQGDDRSLHSDTQHNIVFLDSTASSA